MTTGRAHWRRLSREMFLVGLGQFVAALGGVVGVRLMTGLLTPTAYGELALSLTTVMLLHQVVFGPLSAAGVRFFAPALEAGQLHPYLRTVGGFVLRATILIGLLALGAALILLRVGLTRWLGLFALALLFSLCTGYSVVMDGMQNAARQRAVVAWHDGATPWLRFVLAATLIVASLRAQSSVAMLGYLLGSLVILASQSFFFWRRILALGGTAAAHPGVDRVWRGQMWAYAWPFTTWGVFTWLQQSSDRWALQTFSVTRDVGLYAALYQVGFYPISLLSGLLVQVGTPILFSRAGDGSDLARVAWVRRVVNILVAAIAGTGLLAGAVLATLHADVFAVLVAPEYRSVSYLLPVVVWSAGFFAAGQVAAISLMSGLQTRHLIAPKIATALIGVSLNIAGGLWLGLPGVVGAGLIFSLTYLLWIMALSSPWFKNLRLALSGTHQS